MNSYLVKSRASRLRPVRSISYIRQTAGRKEENKLDEGPTPTTVLWLVGVISPALLFVVTVTLRTGITTTHAIQILYLDGYDIKVIGEFTGLRTEAEMCN